MFTEQQTIAQLRKPAQQLCLDCHGPQSPNGPRTATLEEHTHHKQDSPGSQCIACHMPQIETEGPPNTFVRSHTFKFIAPASTVKVPDAQSVQFVPRRQVVRVGNGRPYAIGMSGRLGG
jgi:mono/diheme cytochrome c family protein